MQCNMLYRAVDPTQFRILPTGKRFARCNHARCDVHRIDAVDRLH
jgi:hypothetical protein